MEKQAINEVKRTITLKNCFVKAFLFSDGSSSRRFSDAKKHLKNNEEVRIVVHAKRMGCWISSRIEKYNFGLGQKFVETKRHIYLINGIEPIQRIKEAIFYVEGVSGGMSTKNTLDLAKVLQFLQLGAKVNAQVFEKNGSVHTTEALIEYNPAKRYFVTESRSIYHW